MTAWEPDVLPGYWQQTLPLGADPDGEGDLVATLVRAGDDERHAGHAVLVVHGFTDYFFHTEVAEAFIGRGFAFYALDLHKCGRSWREGQTPHFTTDLSRYDRELERVRAALERQLRLEPAPLALIDEAVSVLGGKPGGVSSKVSVELQFDQHSARLG